MKKITEKIEVIKYEACDGKTFESKYECERYEWFKKMSKIPKISIETDFNEEVVFQNGRGVEIENSLDLGVWDVIHIRNQEDLELVKHSREYVGYDMPKDLGTFIYLHSVDKWVRLETLMIKVDTLGK